MLGRNSSNNSDAASKASPPIAEDPSFSSIGLNHQTFTSYVEDKDDLIGFVAYSIYKQHKIDFLVREYKKTQHRALQEKVDAFCESYCNPEQVALLRERAEKLILNMHALLAADAISKVKAEEEEKYLNKLKEGPGWVDSLLKSVGGNILTAALIAFVVFGGSVVSNGFWETVGNWSGKTISDKKPSNEQPQAPKELAPQNQ